MCPMWTASYTSSYKCVFYFFANLDYSKHCYNTSTSVFDAHSTQMRNQSLSYRLLMKPLLSLTL